MTKKLLLSLVLLTCLLVGGCVPMLFVAASAQNAQTQAELVRTQAKMYYTERGVLFESVWEYNVPKEQIGSHPIEYEDVLHIMVKAIKPKSDAEKAGLRAGDEVIEINGKPSSAWNQISGKLFQQKENEPIVLGIKRKDFVFTVTLLSL